MQRPARRVAAGLVAVERGKRPSRSAATSVATCEDVIAVPSAATDSSKPACGELDHVQVALAHEHPGPSCGSPSPASNRPVQLLPPCRNSGRFGRIQILGLRAIQHGAAPNPITEPPPIANGEHHGGRGRDGRSACLSPSITSPASISRLVPRRKSNAGLQRLPVVGRRSPARSVAAVAPVRPRGLQVLDRHQGLPLSSRRLKRATPIWLASSSEPALPRAGALARRIARHLHARSILGQFLDRLRCSPGPR